MAHHVHLFAFIKKIGFSIAALMFFMFGMAQCPADLLNAKKISSVKTDSTLSEAGKLQYLYALKKRADDCNVPRDSIYAMLLYRIGFYEYAVNKNYANAIELTKQSIKINSLPQKNTSKFAALKAYDNLGLYYIDILQYSLASASFDSVISIGERLRDTLGYIVGSKVMKADIFFLSGDYQKCVEECTKGIVYALSKKDTANYIEFLIQRSQSLFFQNRMQESLSDIDLIFKTTRSPYNLASAFKTKALIFEKRKSFALAEEYFKQAVNLRLKSNYYPQITSDFNDLGNFYLYSLNNIEKAKKSYYKAIEYALKANSSKLAYIYTNLGNLNCQDRKYDKAIEYYLKTFSILKIPGDNFFENPPAAILNTIGNTNLVTDLLSHKVLLLLSLYKETNDKKYISASIKTALVTDTVISQKRHQQLGEQSKLYWRDQSRGFFTDAIEACFIANDAPHAFYFMEKSRAVLLNDKLNELGASAHLSDADAQKEQDLKIKLFNEQQKLNELTLNTPLYNTQQQVFLKSQDDLENFIKSLETKSPAYYNYKYSDKIPALGDLQKYLALNKSAFVHYFTNDTIAYALSITANSAAITKITKESFNYDEVNQFLRYCANKDVLNNKANYKSFVSVSNKLYKALFQPLQIASGRVVICSDNFLIPFDALYSDAEGKNFLIRDYIFSYVYSATYLLKQFATHRAKGNFIGFAPVNFQYGLHVNPLVNSASALSQSAGNYSSSLLFTHNAATKNNFIKNIGNYTVVNIFSHASADSSKSEPALYMQDATINLSELQLLNKPATSLVVLSACQTNVGKNATGEGIYSLARGFASAGIPSVSATLWKADEDMIYKVSAKFNEYLAQGLSKDIALHKAKLDYLNENASGEKLMPYYWANIILIGNTAPLELTTSLNWAWTAAGVFIAVLLVLGMLIIWKRRSPAKKPAETGTSKDEMKYNTVF
ncbi:MAG: hypothetical protein JWP81_3951 [Ferruginibacter sp.]|nr:hypothetical protein [Ferruginibacter sp.]